MLRKQVDIAREEMLRHNMAAFRCTCGAPLTSSNRSAYADHVATEVVIALERYALGNPESGPEPKREPVTENIRTFVVDGEVHLTSDAIGSRPLVRRTMVGNKMATHAVEIKVRNGGMRELFLTETEMNGFIESMAGKK